jgi:hypothetical protein
MSDPQNPKPIQCARKFSPINISRLHRLVRSLANYHHFILHARETPFSRESQPLETIKPPTHFLLQTSRKLRRAKGNTVPVKGAVCLFCGEVSVSRNFAAIDAKKQGECHTHSNAVVWALGNNLIANNSAAIIIKNQQHTHIALFHNERTCA